MDDVDLKKVFRNLRWPGGGKETVSGAGSTLAYTKDFRSQLSALLRNLNVKRFLDAPCGDFNWMNHVDLTGINYVGLDIIGAIIKENQKKYTRDNIEFRESDICVDRLPPADLILCRDVLIHLPFSFIFKLLDNIVSADIPYIALSSSVNPINKELDTPGHSRGVNLTSAPFSFPVPLGEMCIPDWVSGYPRRYIYVYKREELIAALGK